MNILICDKDLNYNNNFLSSYNIFLAYCEQDIVNITYEHNINLAIVNFYFYKTIKYIKEYGNKSIVIFLDEYYDINNLKFSFDIGDEYLVKPIIFNELRIRVDYFYKKVYSNFKKTIKYKQFYYNITTNQLFKDTTKIKLSPNELKIVELFFLNQNKPISKDILFEALKSFSDGSLRVYISKLKKIGFEIDYDRATSCYILVA